LEVEQVGGGFFEISIGPLFLALAAVFAAGLAAWVARKNHEEQLAHDRAMRDLSHARQGLSAAVETVADAIDSVTKLSIAVSEADSRRQHAEDVEASNDEFLETFERDGKTLMDTRSEQQREAASVPLLLAEEVVVEEERKAVQAEIEAIGRTTDARDAYAPLMTRLMADTLRLRIAIGNDSEVVKRHAILVDAITTWAESLHPDRDGRYRFDTDPAQEVELVSDPMEAFVEASQAWAADPAWL
jgi:hypothetical protein